MGSVFAFLSMILDVHGFHPQKIWLLKVIFRREFRQQMLLQKVHNYSRLAVFGLEEKILLHLQRSSVYTTIKLTFLKSVSRWYLDYHKLVHDHWRKNSKTNDCNHREEVEHALRKQLGMAQQLSFGSSALSEK